MIDQIRTLSILSSRVQNDLNDLKQLIELTEQSLKKESMHLQKRVDKELQELQSKEEKEFITGWYKHDFNQLDEVYPNLQRRALFTTLMCMTEANLLFTCYSCHIAFKIKKPFKKNGNMRVIVQALSYLQKHLKIRDRNLNPYWETIQNLWTIRNAIVHNDGIPRKNVLPQISVYCESIPTLELDNNNSIILHAGSVQMALHEIQIFFSRLIDEIKRN